MSADPPGQTGNNLIGQTVVVIGGSSGIGLETARQARSSGADVVLTGRDEKRLTRAAEQVGAIAAATLDLNDVSGPRRFFAGLPTRVDHVLVTGGGPFYAPIAELDFGRTSRMLVPASD